MPPPPRPITNPRAARRRRQQLAPTDGAPADHPGGGYYEAAQAYGDAVLLVRAWYRRRAELVAGCHAEGVSYARIASLLGVTTDHARRLHRDWNALVARYDERAADGGDVVGL